MTADEPLALFDLDPPASAPAGPAERLSAGRRLTLRQAATIAQGWHPLGPRLHPEAAPAEPRDAPGRRCGNCRWRTSRLWGDTAGHYPKCWHGWNGTSAPRATRGPATDCRAWWPGCVDHEPVPPAE